MSGREQTFFLKPDDDLDWDDEVQRRAFAQAIVDAIGRGLDQPETDHRR